MSLAALLYSRVKKSKEIVQPEESVKKNETELLNEPLFPLPIIH